MSNSPWISVKDRLPEKEGQYFVLKDLKIKPPTLYPDVLHYTFDLNKFDDYAFYEDEYKGKPGWVDGGFGDAFEVRDVVYWIWLPIPELPEIEKKEN